MFLLKECRSKKVIYARDFMAACNLRSPPHLQPTSHLLSIFLSAPSLPFPLLFQLVFKKPAAEW